MKRPGILFCAVLLVVGVAHGLALQAPFQFDDLHQIAGNPAFLDLASLPRFFVDPWLGSTSTHTPFYRPVLFTTFLFDGLIGQGAVWPYRLTSLLLLLFLGLAAARFTRLLLPRLISGVDDELARRAGFWTALILVAHPLLSESILLATGRSSLLMALFGLLALTGLLRWEELERKARVLVPLLVLLALLTKEEAVALALPALLLTQLTRRELVWWRRPLAAWPVLLPIGLYLVFFLFLRPELIEATRPEALASATGARAWSQKAPLFDRPPQGGLALLGLLRLAVVPWGLSLVHEVPPPTGLQALVGWSVWPALAALCWGLLRREGLAKATGFSLAWFSLSLVLILVYGLNTPMAEHRLPLAMVGGVLVVGLGVARLERGRGLAGGGLVGLLALLSLLQALPWSGARTLWEHEVKVSPKSARAWSFLARAMELEGDLRGAKAALAPVVVSNPDHPLYLAQAASVALELGEVATAGDYLRRSLAVDPAQAGTQALQARWLATVGRLLEAEAAAERAVELAPSSSAYWNTLGTVRFMRGLPSAHEAYRRALELDPANEEARHNLGLVERRFGPGRARSAP
ncbi:MAG: hypothetical protein P1V51_01930 [Deltaproteobacteria bacterium]|nr:hypothetical protein [Deltaproteobacteria bacterium]